MTKRRNININDGQYSRVEVSDDEVYVEEKSIDTHTNETDKKKPEYREYNDNRTGEKREGWKNV
ncbi:hypothetical protein [Limnoraphis robusta]|uniref:Uncharacterized protein n=1 Tax=Limnoraphis robusta CCNP1315 TaxID=3110306 RepID=A0ABU5TVL5_9CYAN|nr:hypothetical protein [Limnoraphis robusta]MEA5518742.1 hypothetical protein [Limnoraphis robusta CCNP1315]MEA5544255.1 hypothetical protein [Limnoraphis robusta CCNP1324]